jgi:hypothetical protein
MEEEGRIGRHLCDTFPIQAYLKEGDILSPVIFSVVSERAIKAGVENQEGLKLNALR